MYLFYLFFWVQWFIFKFWDHMIQTKLMFSLTTMVMGCIELHGLHAALLTVLCVHLADMGTVMGHGSCTIP